MKYAKYLTRREVNHTFRNSIFLYDILLLWCMPSLRRREYRMLRSLLCAWTKALVQYMSNFFLLWLLLLWLLRWQALSFDQTKEENKLNENKSYQQVTSRSSCGIEYKESTVHVLLWATLLKVCFYLTTHNHNFCLCSTFIVFTLHNYLFNRHCKSHA